MTSTELGYLSGVTSNIQTQLDGKANSGHNHDSLTRNLATSAGWRKIWIDTIDSADTSAMLAYDDNFKYDSNKSSLYIRNMYYPSGVYIKSDEFAGLKIYRSNTNDAGITFENSTGILGHIAMSGTTDSAKLIRYDKSTSNNYLILDLENASDYLIPNSNYANMTKPISASTTSGDIINANDGWTLLGYNVDGSLVSGSLFGSGGNQTVLRSNSSASLYHYTSDYGMMYKILTDYWISYGSSLPSSGTTGQIYFLKS